MTKTKALSIITAAVMGFSCMGMTAFAEVGAPEDYPSVMTDVDAELLAQWETAALRSLETKFITPDKHTITFSEPYYNYDFYDMSVNTSGTRLVFVDGELYGYSGATVTGWQDYDFVSAPAYAFKFDFITEELEDALANGEKVLFGNAIVNQLPNSLIYIDGEFYSDNSIVYTGGRCNLVFGEIPYSQSYLENMEYEDDGTLIPGMVITTTTEPTENDVVYSAGDVNMDGVVSMLDAVIISRISASLMAASEEQMALADCCDDDMINSSDSSALIQYLVGKVPTLPVIA